MGQYQRLCVIGNSYADKGAKWGVDKHPSSVPLRKFIKNLDTSYMAICKLMVASCLKVFDLRPRVPKIDKGIRLLDTKNKALCHTPSLTGVMAGFSAVLASGPLTVS